MTLAKNSGAGTIEKFKTEYPFMLIENYFDPSVFDSRGTDIKNAAKKALERVQVDGLDEKEFFGLDALTKDQKDALIAALGSIQVNSAAGTDTYTITINGVTRTYHEENNELVRKQ